MACSQPHRHGTAISGNESGLGHRHLLVQEGWVPACRAVLTYCVVRRELEEVGGQDGRREEPQENEAAHRCVPHVQVI